jgi:hypothetical protein
VQNGTRGYRIVLRWNGQLGMLAHPLVARSGRADLQRSRLLWEGKRTCPADYTGAGNDPKRTFAAVETLAPRAQKDYASMMTCSVLSQSATQRKSAMKWSKWPFAVLSLHVAVLLPLSIGTLNARDAGVASLTFAAAQTPKQQCISNCRARYRDCRHVNQLSSFECRGVYQDCTRYSCTGLGPG